MRSWPQRLLIAINLGLVAVGAAAVGVGTYLFLQLDDIDVADVPTEAFDQPQPPGEPENFLLVGSDGRAGLEGDRADVIMLVRVDPAAGRAAMVSFPRDLYVPVAPTGELDRINTAFAGGPQGLIETIRTVFGVPVHHYAQVDFEGFRDLVDAIGGVELFVPTPIRDEETGLNITDTGCVRFHGDQALAYVRSRHLESLTDGEWEEDLRSDLGRIDRQQDLVRRAVRTALAGGMRNPATLHRLVRAGLDNVSIDAQLSPADLVSLGQHFQSLAPESLARYSLPVVDVWHGRQLVLEIPASGAPTVDAIMAVFRGAEPAAPAAPGVAATVPPPTTPTVPAPECV